MTIAEILSQIEINGSTVKSKSTGREYAASDFIKQISQKCKLSKSETRELESCILQVIKPQSDKSKFTENLIDKYGFTFFEGIYMTHGKQIHLDNIYRLLWKEEKLLPSEVDIFIEDMEKISIPIDIRHNLENKIKQKAIPGRSKYLASLRGLYSYIDWKGILYNILAQDTKPLFHIFYDDGVGGTGKSTLLEVLTMVVGESNVSNVLLDQFGNRFIFANMLGKYLNIGDDNGKNEELQNIGTLKSIITGNRVTIDRKNIQPIEVRIFAKQLFATNILPYIDFTDGGIMRRLNIVKMNKVIPKGMKLPKLDETEIGHLIYEVMIDNPHDLEESNSELAIINSPLYRFYTTTDVHTYEKYRYFCSDYGFRCMNVINYEVKSKFILDYINRNKAKLNLSRRELLEAVEDLDF